jgi:uncharacterized protein YyaL (SSP411 family)
MAPDLRAAERCTEGSMKFAATSFTLLLILSCELSAGVRARPIGGPAPVPLRQPYLDAAREAAAWLETLERRAANGALSWPSSEGAAGASTGVDLGAAGIGAFHLRLYEATGQRSYLDKAIGAGEFIAGSYGSGGGGVDWLGGRAGGGDYFLALYEATGDSRWLDEAKKAAAALISVSLGNSSTIYWRNGNFYTGLAHGAAGIGLFFVHLHEETGDSQYLDVAMRAYRWMMQHTLPAGGGVTFKRLTTDSSGYHGWCGGSVGAAIFFEELARVSGSPEVEQAWRSTLEGLLDTADRLGSPANPQLAWRYGPDSTGSHPIIYCHGGAATAAVLARAFLATGDGRYRDAALSAGRWLDAKAVREPEGLSWYHIDRSKYHELGFLTGTASVGHSSVELYRALGEASSLDRARSAAAWLLSMAQHPVAGQSKWITRTDTVGGVPRYDTGWYMGAAGIGLFLLELHDAERGDVLPRRFSIANP